MVFPVNFWILFGICMLVSAIGFKNYGNDPEYQKYVTTVPILLPFIPLYSVKKHKWLVA